MRERGQEDCPRRTDDLRHLILCSLGSGVHIKHMIRKNVTWSLNDGDCKIHTGRDSDVGSHEPTSSRKFHPAPFRMILDPVTLFSVARCP